MPEWSGAPNEFESAQTIFAIDHRFMGEGAAGAAVFLRDGGAKQARRAGRVPDLARIDVVFVPLLDMRREFLGDEALGLLFQQQNVFGHPCRTGEIEGAHGDPGGGS